MGASGGGRGSRLRWQGSDAVLAGYVLGCCIGAPVGIVAFVVMALTGFGRSSRPVYIAAALICAFEAWLAFAVRGMQRKAAEGACR